MSSSNGPAIPIQKRIGVHKKELLMELSTEFAVNSKGLLIREVYDSHSRESFEINVFGVHKTAFNVWIWNPTKGPAKKFSEDWLRTEDGQDFQKFMEDNDFKPDGDDLI